MKRGSVNWKSHFNRGGGSFQRQTDKPLITVTMPNLGRGGNDSDDENKSDVNKTGVSFSTQRELNSFIGWKLYFAEKSFKDSHDIVRQVRAAEKHFKTHKHWYDFGNIEESCELPLKLENLEEDKIFLGDWPNFRQLLKTKSTETLACLALAVHNIILEAQDPDNKDSYQHKKIYTRPIGFQPQLKIKEVHKTKGVLVTTTGTVIKIEPPKVFVKMVCFKCRKCASELVVKQKPGSKQCIHPSSCHSGCKARGHFTEMLSHPFTMFHSKQMVQIQEAAYVSEQEYKVLNVALSRELVESVTVGNVVTVTGIIKHEKQQSSRFTKKRESNLLQFYLKCFSVEVVNRYLSQSTQLAGDSTDFLHMMRSEPSPFRTLVHSLCPTFFGREEIKAGLLLCLLSGNDLLNLRRSQSHILLVGSPGTGKSKLLLACVEASGKGIYVNGPTSTGVGLTAKVGDNGTIDAGALILADQGVCCIDEFDKINSASHFLLESMEQQFVSIVKCGVQINSPARTSIIAAANPIGSFYDKSRTILENVRISKPLMSRFDLIFSLSALERNQDEKFFAHLNSRSIKGESSRSSSFFKSEIPKVASRASGTSWLKLEKGEEMQELPAQLLQFYIGHARENIKPTLSDEASAEIKGFFTELRQLNGGSQMQQVTFRLLEGLMRLTLCRARADLREIATRDDAIDVINLFKFSMVDIFDQDDPTQSMNATSIKKQIPNLSTQSKPKQMKAFIEHWRDLSEAQDRQEFTTVELKAIAKELGVKDFYDIVDTLNYNCEIIQIVDGYKIL